MPTYNRATVLADAVNSVAAQTHTNWELLVIDDGSDDDTAAVIEAIRGRWAGGDGPTGRLRYVRQANAGPGSARNLALGLARGDYCAYLDSDNVWLPQYLQTMLEALITEDADWGYADLERLADGKVVDRLGRDFDRDECLRSNFVDLNVLMHRSNHSEARFDERLRRNEDWDLVLRLSTVGDPVHVRFVGCRYRADDDPDRVSVSGLNVFSRIVQERNRESTPGFDVSPMDGDGEAPVDRCHRQRRPIRRSSVVG